MSCVGAGASAARASALEATAKPAKRMSHVVSMGKAAAERQEKLRHRTQQRSHSAGKANEAKGGLADAQSDAPEDELLVVGHVQV